LIAFEVKPLAPIATTLIVALALFSRSNEIFGSVVVNTIGLPTSGVIVTRYLLAPAAFFQLALSVVA